MGPPLRRRPAPSPGPPPPPRWPVLAPSGSALGPRRYAARSGRPALSGGPVGPLCGAPARAGVRCRPRGPPAGACRRPLAAVIGGWFLPPRRPGGPPVPGLGVGGGAPPRGPGLVLALAWCRPELPTRRRGGALGPAAVWPSLLAFAPCPRGRRSAAAKRQPPRCQHVRHGIQRRHGRTLVVQRPAHPLNISILRHEVNRINLPGGMGTNVLRQAEGPRSPLDVLPNRLPCFMATPR